MISEQSAPVVLIGAGRDYCFGRCIELYSNSDTTVYLDGKVIARGWIRVPEDPRSPGSGHPVPLDRGEAVIVATGTIDHTECHPHLQHLSDADFEFIGLSDAHNPGGSAGTIARRTAAASAERERPAVQRSRRLGNAVRHSGLRRCTSASADQNRTRCRVTTCAVPR